MFGKLGLFAVYLLSISALLESKPLELDVQADSAILMNADTGAVLYEKNAHKIQYPASLTKIATAFYAIKVRGSKLDKLIAAQHSSIASISQAELERSNYTLPSYWLVHGASHIGIKKGEILSLKDLLYGNLIASGGDASNVIAQYIGGTIPSFMNLLNADLQEMGCYDTFFKNPHGLHHPDHVTTAYDMATLTRKAMEDPIFCEIVQTVRYTRPETNMQRPTTLIQTNRLLKKGKHYYSKATGVKTGYTSKAKNTLVAAAREGNRTLIAVLLKCKDKDEMYSDAKQLFLTAFQETPVKRRLFSSGPQKTALKLPHAAKELRTYLKENIVLEYYPAEEPKIKCVLKWDPLELPIAKGHRVGVVHLKDANDRTLSHTPLFALESVDYSVFYRLKQFFAGKRYWALAIVGIVALLLFLRFRRKRRGGGTHFFQN